MHDPNVWEAANKEKIEASKRAKAEAAAKAAAEAKAAEREQMKAEIIAELTAAGVIPAEPKKAGRKPKAEKQQKQRKRQAIARKTTRMFNH